MNSDLIYLEETIQHNSLLVYLYILRLPTYPLEQKQLQEIISKKNISIIFNFGTQSLKFENVRVINQSQEISEEKVIENMQEELIKKQFNIGLMCSKRCEKSLKIYFHYMVKIEQRKFEDFQYYLFEHIWSNEQLKQLYEQIKKSKTITIFDYDLLKTNSNIVSQMSSQQCQSEIITAEQPKIELIQSQTNDDNMISNGSYQQSQIQNHNFSKILGNEDQVKSEFFPQSELFKQSENFKDKYEKVQHNENNNKQNQHSLKFENKYKLPQSITFIHFMSQNGFRCLE